MALFPLIVCTPKSIEIEAVIIGASLINNVRSATSRDQMMSGYNQWEQLRQQTNKQLKNKQTIEKTNKIYNAIINGQQCDQHFHL